MTSPTAEVLADLRDYQDHARQERLREAEQRRQDFIRYNDIMAQIAKLAQSAKALRTDASYIIKAEALEKLTNLRLTRVHGEADWVDAVNIRSDLEALCGIVDPLVRAIGSHAGSNIHGINEDLFCDQLRGALEGNAMYEIEQAGERLREDAERDGRLWAAE